MNSSRYMNLALPRLEITLNSFVLFLSWKVRLCKPVPHLSILDDEKILDEEISGACNKGHGINRKATTTVHVNEMQYMQ